MSVRSIECIVDDFFLSLQPVTNAEYSRFTRETGHRSPAIYELPLVVKAGGAERERSFRQGRHAVCLGRRPPVDRSVGFIRSRSPDTTTRRPTAPWLSASTGKAFRLPTEAEWGEGRARRRRVQTVSVGGPSWIATWRTSSWTRP
jgi:formylglycine-generating enzyme required for sulfatase activity